MAVDLGSIDRLSLPPILAISALSLAELIAGTLGAKQELSRARRLQHLQYLEANLEPLPFDPRCSRAYGPVYAAMADAGRKPRGGRAVDVMIAATALAHDLPLWTRNAKDLRGLEQLIEIVDVGS